MLNFPNTKLAIDRQHFISPSQKVFLEWNYNIHAGIAELGIDDIPLYSINEQGDLEIDESSSVLNSYMENLYPLNSVVSFLRPGEHAIHNNQKVGGIVKAIYGNTPSATTNYDVQSSVRRYMVSSDDTYKYWAHLRKNVAGGSVNKSVYVKYDRPIRSNKIVVKFETQNSTPTNYSVFVFKNNAWSQIFTSTTPLTNGGLLLYWNGTSWTTTSPSVKNITTVDTFTGVKVLVSSVNVGYSPLEIIEISPRLEVDISQEVASWSVEKTLFEDQGVLPIGDSSSNSASVVFDNTSNDFSYENVNAKYYGMIDKRIGIKIYTVIGNDTIPQFTGYIDNWDITANEEVSVECYDIAKILQQTDSPDVVFEDNTKISKIVRMMFDYAGLNEAIIDATSTDSDYVTSFWSSQDKSIWESLQDLCVAHQCVIYIDEYGRPVFKSRSSIFDSVSTNYDFTYNQSGQTLPNIVSVEQSARPRIGNLTIKYARRGFETRNDIQKTYNAGRSANEAEAVEFNAGYAKVLWQPSSQWVLGAAPLVYPISINEESEIQISTPKIRIQNFVDKNTGKQRRREVLSSGIPQLSGYFYLNGEIIYFGSTEFYVQYRSKPAEYRDFANSEDLEAFIKSDPDILLVKNAGKLKNIKRAQFGTERKNHVPASPDLSNWSLYNYAIGGSLIEKNNLPAINQTNASLRLSVDNKVGSRQLRSLPAQQRRNQMKIALAELKRSNNKRFDTTIRIVDKVNSEQADLDSIGGIIFDFNLTTQSGYLVEVAVSEIADNYVNSKKKVWARSIAIHKLVNGNLQTLASTDQSSLNIVRDFGTVGWDDNLSIEQSIDYDIQVFRSIQKGLKYIDVYIQGQLVLSTIDSGSPSISNTRYAGVYVRGESAAHFSKFAAWAANESGDIQATPMFSDSPRSFVADMIIADRLQNNKEIDRLEDYDYYEFYPFMREIRIADFDYTTAPALPITIALGAASSAYSAAVLEANSFRMKAVFVNDTNGTLPLGSFVPGQPSAEYPKVIGVPIKKFEPGEYSIRISNARIDDATITLESEWIQSDRQAQEIANFIKDNSSVVREGRTNDVIDLQMEVFSNPIIQLGDIVSVNHPDLGLSSASHSFIIKGISQSFDNGINTTISLREIS